MPAGTLEAYALHDRGGVTTAVQPAPRGERPERGAGPLGEVVRGGRVPGWSAQHLLYPGAGQIDLRTGQRLGVHSARLVRDRLGDCDEVDILGRDPVLVQHLGESSHVAE